MLLKFISSLLLFFAGAVAGAETPPPTKTLVILFANSGNALMVKENTTMVVRALNALGYQVEFRSVPLSRGTAVIYKEAIDGELVRVREYGDFHPELVRVEEPIATANFSIYSKPGKKIPCAWDELIRSNLRIDYQRGVFYLEMNLKKYLSDRIRGIDYPEQMFQRLRSNRSDLFLLDKQSADNILNNSKEKWDMERVCDIHTAPTYMYLKAQHAELAKKLPAELRRIKKESPAVRMK
ncbi:hypothetical protein [Bdellovibrio sp. KM01]|uniref:hypothetical protein n=1 Tax=Bdellovibrio sp. KM01 TaxID=2748865 RepID=UPI0015E9DE39|nr:hypothetical protein [Bdellovibrio sp. KM01]QLY26614.1 hypothetical protein HW988_06240 [Bdellovibrio sp. KM01]